METRAAQQRVYRSVEERGYVYGWTRDQLIARQVQKLTEELYELAENISVTRIDLLAKAAAEAKSDFDGKRIPDLRANDEGLAKELADIQVVVFMIAEALGVDVVTLAVQKATKDIARGVRGVEQG